MTNLTNSIGTRDWLEATKGMMILGYVEPTRVEFPADEGSLIRDDFERALKKVARRPPKRDQGSS